MREITETQTPGRSLKGKRDRRAFLAAAAGAAAGATAATLLPQSAKPADAAPGDLLIVGQGNDGDDQTTVLTGTAKGVAPGTQNTVLHVENVAEDVGEGEDATGITGTSKRGSAIQGISETTAGVEGHTRGSPSASNPWVVGVAGFSRDASGTGPGAGTGVSGASGSGPGVDGHSETGQGVLGLSESGPGVVGNSESGPGVEGHSEGMAGVWGTGRLIGVLGWTREGGTAGVAGQAPGEIPGVIAHTQAPGGPMPPDGGVALLVTGRARFATAGAGTVPARASTATVSNAAVRADSHVTVTFTGDPGGASVGWVERQPDTGFIVHLSGRARWPVPFTYLIVEPGT